MAPGRCPRLLPGCVFYSLSPPGCRPLKTSGEIKPSLDQLAQDTQEDGQVTATSEGFQRISSGAVKKRVV